MCEGGREGGRETEVGKEREGGGKMVGKRCQEKRESDRSKKEKRWIGKIASLAKNYYVQ